MILDRLFQYDDWANGVIREALTANPRLLSDATTCHLYSHILGAGQTWLWRIEGEEGERPDVWPDLDPETWASTQKTLSEAWQRILSSHDLGTIVSYHNSKGTAFSTLLSDILHHVVIHGQHHRAQVAMRMRALGVAPPPTDYIIFCRTLAG